MQIARPRRDPRGKKLINEQCDRRTTPFFTGHWWRAFFVPVEVLHFGEGFPIMWCRITAIHLFDSPRDLIRTRDGESNVPPCGEPQRPLAVDVERISRGDQQFLFG